MLRAPTFGFLAAAGLLAGCAPESLPASPYDDGAYPVSDLDALMADAPDNKSLVDDTPVGARFDALHAGLVALQSPVKSQGRRGVCSIFSTAALMEHLYLVEGTLPEPDFSEQYLQWSAKFEVGAFPNTSGSNAYSNLRAVSEYGIPAEQAWPYETNQWGVADDAECDGEDDQPTRCYTNGAPPASALAAPKYTLPRGRWLNPRSIKSHITSRGTAVVVGMTFFYQSWNHRASELPVNTEYWREGIVLYPNETDREKSLEKRAGHSILIVGWDDDKEVQTVDHDGNPVFDDTGAPVTEKGFYIFKNSWGTGSFGVDNPHGDGYGYLSMAYVHQYGTAYVSDVPTLEVPVEICGDGLDNDGNGVADCDDAACVDALECSAADVRTFSAAPALAIPDNDAAGVASAIDVADEGTIASATVAVDIAHTYRGDLTVSLVRDGQTIAVLHDRRGGGEDDLVATFDVASLEGESLAGRWELRVSDRAAYDVGTLEAWSLEVALE